MLRSGFASVGRRWHRRLDTASGALLLFLLIFAPWGAGGTAIWSSWVMIVTGWILGGLVLSKWALMYFTGFEPVRWRREGGESRWPVWVMSGLTVFLLLQVGISLWNARAEAYWSQDGVEFLYRDIVEWLPTTYDLAATRKAFFRYLAFAGAFWAMHDWLRIKSRVERHREEDGRDEDDAGHVPNRIRWILWTLSINGAVMALIGILHRLDGSPELLWSKSLGYIPNSAMFGPFPYRGNAAQFINLIWPLSLGLWWALRMESLRPSVRPARSGSSPYPLLLLCVSMMVAGVFVAGSRMGIAIAVVQMGLGLLVFDRAVKGWRPRAAIAIAFVGALAMGWTLAGDRLKARFANSLVDDTLSGRKQTYFTARKMAADFPVWGSGAESYLTLNGLYRKPSNEDWQGYVHDDWLETRVTFGWVGFAAVLGAMGMIPLLQRWAGVVPVASELRRFAWVAVLGVLVHARLDFPFQIPSVCFLFLCIAALHASITVPGAAKASAPGA